MANFPIYTYTPSNWYWVVNNSGDQVWSSSAMSYVDVSDSTYQSWLSSGFLPTKIDTAVNLADVMQSQVVPSVFAAGVTITSTSTSSLDGWYSADNTAQQNITAISTGISAGKPLPGGGETFAYLDATGAPHSFTGDQFLNFANGVENYIYNYVMGVNQVVAGSGATLPSSEITIA